MIKQIKICVKSILLLLVEKKKGSFRHCARHCKERWCNKFFNSKIKLESKQTEGKQRVRHVRCVAKFWHKWLQPSFTCVFTYKTSETQSCSRFSFIFNTDTSDTSIIHMKPWRGCKHSYHTDSRVYLPLFCHDFLQAFFQESLFNLFN